MVRTLLAGLGLAFVIIVGAMAIQAQDSIWPSPRPAKLGVSFTDINLHTTPGIAALEGRLGNAIRDVCGLDLVCRRSAYIGTRPQIAKAVAIGRLAPDDAFSIEPALLDLSADQRRWIEAPLLRAFKKNKSLGWYAWPDQGRIAISDVAIYDGVECRNVRVTQAHRDGDEILAEGLRCIVPGLLPTPITIRHP